MLDRDVHEVEGRQLDHFTYPEDLAKGEAALALLKSGASDEYDLEKR
jgi:hypothetical protein